MNIYVIAKHTLKLKLFKSIIIPFTFILLFLASHNCGEVTMLLTCWITWLWGITSFLAFLFVFHCHQVSHQGLVEPHKSFLEYHLQGHQKYSVGTEHNGANVSCTSVTWPSLPSLTAMFRKNFQSCIFVVVVMMFLSCNISATAFFTLYPWQNFLTV